MPTSGGSALHSRFFFVVAMGNYRLSYVKHLDKLVPGFKVQAEDSLVLLYTFPLRLRGQRRFRSNCAG